MYSVLFNSRERKMNYRPKSSLAHELEVLGNVFKDFDRQIFLVGGVGLAVRKGHFHRNHKDFDLAIFIDDFDHLADYLINRDFKVVKRTFTTKITKDLNIDIYQYYPSLDINRGKYSNLMTKILNQNRPSKVMIRYRLDMIDLLLLEKCDQGVIAHGFDTTIPWKDFYPMKRLFQTSGIYLPNINYKKHFIPKTDRQRDDLDRVGLKPMDY